MAVTSYTSRCFSRLLAVRYGRHLVYVSLFQPPTCCSVWPSPRIRLVVSAAYLLFGMAVTSYTSRCFSRVLAVRYGRHLVYVSLFQPPTCCSVWPSPRIRLVVSTAYLLFGVAVTSYTSRCFSRVLAVRYGRHLVYVSLFQPCTCCPVWSSPRIRLVVSAVYLLSGMVVTSYTSRCFSRLLAVRYGRHLVYVSLFQPCTCCPVWSSPRIRLVVSAVYLLSGMVVTSYTSRCFSRVLAVRYGRHLVYVSLFQPPTCCSV